MFDLFKREYVTKEVKADLVFCAVILLISVSLLGYVIAII